MDNVFTQGNRLFQFMPPANVEIAEKELIGATTASSGKRYFEFQIPTPAVGYHTDTSTYSHMEYKVGFLLYETSNPKVRDPAFEHPIWIEFGYDDGYGECVKKINRPLATEDRVAFTTNTANSQLDYPYDVLGIEIDVDVGRLDTFYINGIQQTITDPNWEVVHIWDAGTVIRPYAYMVNRPFVAIDATENDIVSHQELVSIKLNTSRSDCRYSPTSGYDYFDTTGGGDADVSRPRVSNAYKYYLSDTATTTTTLTIPTNTVIWTTIEWVDSSSTPSLSQLGEIVITTTDSDANMGYAIFNREGVCLFSTTWSTELWYNTKFRVLNGRTYYMAIGFNISHTKTTDFDIAVTGGGTYISEITVNRPPLS